MYNYVFSYYIISNRWATLFLITNLGQTDEKLLMVLRIWTLKIIFVVLVLFVVWFYRRLVYFSQSRLERRLDYGINST